MKNNNGKSGIGAVIGVLLVIFLLKTLFPLLAAFMGVLLVVGIIVLVALVVGIITCAFKSGKDNKKENTGDGKESLNEENASLSEEEKKALRIARSLLTQIRVKTSKIRDIDIRNSFICICDKMEKVFSALNDHPKAFSKGRRVINYYIGSIEEIEKKYIVLEASGTDIEENREKLSKNLLEIQSALDKLYEQLYEEDKLNLIVEMKALSIALKRDGLISDAVKEAREEVLNSEKIIIDAEVIENDETQN